MEFESANMGTCCSIKRSHNEESYEMSVIETDNNLEIENLRLQVAAYRSLLIGLLEIVPQHYLNTALWPESR